jgi:hypothetical protein
MTSIEKQIQKASEKCRTYTACSGCSTTMPNPSEFDECYQDPYSCLEVQANGLFKTHKQQKFGTGTMQRMTDTIQQTGQIAEQIGETGANEYLSDAEAYCSKPHTDINIINFCKQAMNEKIIPSVEETGVMEAQNFIQQRQRDIEATLK